ncbi:MAG: hypothetical protein PHU85_12550 [Phycisphaerae bacterium]|nr:hypothetical protein [Phycisphaerae bacterium]
MNRLACNFWAAMVVFCAVGVSLADTVYLHDGRKIQGKVVSEEGAALVKLDTPMGQMEFKMSEIAKIEKGDAAATPAASPAPKPDTPPAADTPAPSVIPAGVDPKAREKFTEMRKSLENAATGADGQALVEQFLKDFPNGPLAESAKKDLTIWKDRVAKNLVKFGPIWQPKDQADARRAKADELLGKAEAEGKLEDAAKLYDQASGQDPYRVDIPVKKAARCYKDKKMREYGKALGDIVKIEPNNVAARNNMGVLQAQDKQWGAAVGNIGKAAILGETEKILDNLDQVAAMAEQDGQSAAQFEQAIQLVVTQLHNAKQHVGENRWGNAWVKEDEYRKNMAENAEIDKQIAAGKAKFQGMKAQNTQLLAAKTKAENDLKNAQSSTTVYPGVVGRPGTGYGNGTTGYGVIDQTTINNLTNQVNQAKQAIAKLEADGKKCQADITAAEAKRIKPPHAGKLVLLDSDGKAELESITPAGGDKPAVAK